jgi:hypothetical protein
VVDCRGGSAVAAGCEYRSRRGAEMRESLEQSALASVTISGHEYRDGQLYGKRRGTAQIATASPAGCAASNRLHNIQKRGLADRRATRDGDWERIVGSALLVQPQQVAVWRWLADSGDDHGDGAGTEWGPGTERGRKRPERCISPDFNLWYRSGTDHGVTCSHCVSCSDATE